MDTMNPVEEMVFMVYIYGGSGCIIVMGASGRSG